MKILPIFGVVGLVACAGTEKPEVKTTPTINSISISPSEDITTSTELICIATASDEDNDSLIITYQWTDTQGNVLAETDAFVLSPDVVQPTAELTCTATVTDGENTITEQTSVTIGNTDPTVSNVSISPQEVLIDSLLVCTFDSADADLEELTVSYSWTQNGTEVGTESTLQINPTDYVSDDLVVCTVTVEDGFDGTASDSADVVIGNAAPVIGSTTITPDPAHSYDTLTCTANDVIDLELDEVSISYEWSIDGEIQTETSQALEGPFAVGSTISCTTTPNDGKIDGETSDTDTTINNTPPVVDSVTITPAIAYADTLLNCEAAASDVDNEELSISYEWTQSNGTILGVEGELQLDSSIVSPDDILTCTATVTDPHGATDSQEGTVTVSNTAPIVGSAASITGDATTTSTLTCAATFSDLNDGTLTPSYSWTNQSGTELSTTDSYTIAASETETGDELTCTASVEDSDGATLSSSAAVTITNTDPVFDTTASISPNTSVVTDTALTCAAVASDADDGSATLSYSWMVGSSEVSTASTYTVSASDTDVGDSISCTVTATDDDSATATSTASVVVENTEPAVSGTSISGGTYNTDTLTCSATASDVDESVTVAYTWSIDSVDVGTGASIDLGTTAALPTDDVICTALVEDSDGGSASETASLTLVNRLPSTPVVSISPTAPTVGVDDLLCNITTASTDADGQTVSYTYEWTKDSVATSDTTNTISASDVGASETWMCTVTPDDGMDFGSSASDSVTSASACVLTDCDSSLDLGGGYGVDFVNITAGTFTMGSPSSEVGRQTNEDQHSVTLSNDFLVSTTEITQGMYSQLMGYDAHTYSTAYGVGSDYPVYYVNWHMAADFSNKLTEQHNSLNGTSLEECYSCSSSGSTSVSCSTAVTPIYECSGYRLLTEAEWEYAARAGTTAAIWTSNGGGNIPSGYEYSGCSLNWTLSDGTTLGDLGWFCGNNQWSNSSYPFGSKEVATKTANDNGLYDMSGNVYEWTHDTYTGSLGTGATTDPVREIDSDRVFRGGSWRHFPYALRSAGRADHSPSTREFSFVGFRSGRTYTSIP